MGRGGRRLFGFLSVFWGCKKVCCMGAVRKNARAMSFSGRHRNKLCVTTNHPSLCILGARRFNGQLQKKKSKKSSFFFCSITKMARNEPSGGRVGVKRKEATRS